MIEEEQPLAARLKTRFGSKLAAVTERLGQTTIEVRPDHLGEVAPALRDEREFRFAVLIDVCGVDYLSYGQDEWDTDDVSSEGFSRGVEGSAMGRFAWADRPAGGAPSARRFVAVMH